MLNQLLKTLHFDEDDIKTYLILLETGPITAGQLAKKMGIPRSSLYGFLKRLIGHGLVTESIKWGKKLFSPENPEKINLLFSQQREKLENDQKLFAKMLPDLKEKQGQKYVNPKFQVFEGKEALQHALKDMLLYYDLESLAFWPQKKMIETLSPEFFRYHNKERIKNNLSVRAIWPEKQIVEVKQHPYFGVGKEFKREIRISPKEVDSSMGYWIYGNKTVFVSSQAENFGFILESTEFAQMLKVQFEFLWKTSRPLQVNPADTKIFLEELL